MVSTLRFRAAAQKMAREMSARAAPASRRSMSKSIASDQNDKSGFANTWIKPDVYPIVFMMSLGLGFSVFNIGKNAVAHQEVVWSKNHKSRGVSNQYEHKYPGTAGDGPKPGPVLTAARHQ